VLDPKKLRSGNKSLAKDFGFVPLADSPNGGALDLNLDF
jgi:hypothetical protein